MDPIQYQALNGEINDAIDSLVLLRDQLQKVYLKLGPAKETARSLEKEKTRQKRIRKPKISPKLDETDSLPLDADKSPEEQ